VAKAVDKAGYPANSFASHNDQPENGCVSWQLIKSINRYFQRNVEQKRNVSA
jgi:hypothetical protein